MVRSLFTLWWVKLLNPAALSAFVSHHPTADVDSQLVTMAKISPVAVALQSTNTISVSSWSARPSPGIDQK
jgi:hypothetical protein